MQDMMTTKIFAFVALVVVQSVAILAFKLCQIQEQYTFSPASAVALTELLKLFLAVALLYRERMSTKIGSLDLCMVLHYLGLAICYAVNNQLTFYVLLYADPGTLSLFKSAVPGMVAMGLRIFGQAITKLQWSCIIIQCCTITIVQYDVCKGAMTLKVHAYILLAIACSLTSISSVWNQLVVKGFDVSVNLQNSCLYFFGFVISTICFFFERKVGFFEGYHPWSILLVVFQAFHGLAVVFVYKYADAIVKNLANSFVMGIMVAMSAIWFQGPANLHSELGIVIICVITFIYMNPDAIQVDATVGPSKVAALHLLDNKKQSSLEDVEMATTLLKEGRDEQDEQSD